MGPDKLLVNMVVVTTVSFPADNKGSRPLGSLRCNYKCGLSRDAVVLSVV